MATLHSTCRPVRQTGSNAEVRGDLARWLLSGWLAAGCLPGWLAGCLAGWLSLSVWLSTCLAVYYSNIRIHVQLYSTARVAVLVLVAVAVHFSTAVVLDLVQQLY